MTTARWIAILLGMACHPQPSRENVAAAPPPPADAAPPPHTDAAPPTFAGALPEGCYPARMTEPCGAIAWTIALPTGPVEAFVRGAGSPNAGLSLTVLRADENRWAVCGALAEPVDDAECGHMPVFAATSFRVTEPVVRLECADFITCGKPDGTIARREGPPALTAADLDGCGACKLVCDGPSCRIE